MSQAIQGHAGEVIIFHENGIVQSEAMVVPTAAAHGVFFQIAPAGRGLARIVDSCVRACDSLHKPPRLRGNTAQMLHKIEHDTLAG